MTGLLVRLGVPLPVIAAPMAGGPSTAMLVAAVGEAGGLGFLAAGYRTADQLRAQITQVRTLTDRPFGVNLFVPGDPSVDRPALDAYAPALEPVATRLGVALGEPHWEDDEYAAKLELLVAERVPLISFTFGCPSTADVERLREVDTVVAVTVTSPAEAVQAQRAGADALVVQGAEAGGHQGSFHDDPDVPLGAAARPLATLLAELAPAVPLPLIAAGGLMTRDDIAAVLAAGAVAAQLGTAFLCCPEAGTSETHRRALLDPRFSVTAFTRAFTGRTARSLVNGFLRSHTAGAPAAYPWVHHLTRPLRVAAAARGDADALHLWAGEGWQAIRPMPAAELVTTLGAELA
ncbi:nitronate monooxygenase [Micromonospora sp. NPDC049679]|uniref:nitronate monooxygenase n=1 Tax=Micromonospora sp. NPDC049679 TaxID=3155920 RepID=UPI00340E7377